MNYSDGVLRNDEKAIYALRELYGRFGYMLYKVNKFEEYDLYAHNKNFLVSDKVLAFTDTNGKLMALKPDVTLSIIKNIAYEDNTINKLCYNENVYRTSDGDGFKEIMQTGLECVGNVDMYNECEVIMLAAKSLETISNEYILDLSHMGFTDGLLDKAGVDLSQREEILKLIESKNVSVLKAYLNKIGMTEEYCENLCKLVEMYMPLGEALKVIEGCVSGEKMRAAYEELSLIAEMMVTYGVSDKIYLDLSVVNDLNYYDGITFKGFINGIPASVLSGGRYDRLLRKFRKNVGAIGFAVYLDRLERFNVQERKYNVDVLLVYDENADVKKISEAVKKLNDEGKSVLTSVSDVTSVSYKQLVRI
ncbi:MAG: ATP phosphoribosyltransferase regulatory subunit [Clostridia bacterium]|nr:ATP phosphoribosyltransferase regulatory subunit [Clostridia bacterium]